jgi:hypothetical protein
MKICTVVEVGVLLHAFLNFDAARMGLISSRCRRLCSGEKDPVDLKAGCAPDSTLCGRESCLQPVGNTTLVTQSIVSYLTG